MRIVQASASLVAATFPCRIVEGKVEIQEGSPATIIEDAGRTCYKSEDRIGPGTAGRFIRRLLDQETPHESVIEHASATFRIVCDRGVSHELVRHRHTSPSQESTRYCNYGKDKFNAEITVIEPPDLTPAARWIWKTVVGVSEWGYMALLRLGCSPQIARSVLLNSLKTEIVITANFREWRHILRLRTSEQAHPQAREVAKLIEPQLKILCPEVFGG